MTHDPMCPNRKVMADFPSEIECGSCAFIAEIRVDERDQAVQAIQAELIGWSQETKDATGKLQGHAWRAYLGGLEDAINFVRSAEAGR